MQFHPLKNAASAMCLTAYRPERFNNSSIACRFGRNYQKKMSQSFPFSLFGAADPVYPLIISVPHAGRHYPDAMQHLARLTEARLRPLEDRYADVLATSAFAEGIQGIVANTARAWIDLNRSESECDPGFVDLPSGALPLVSAKVRGGLGLIPRRISSGGDIWHRRIGADDLSARIAQHHRPYHQTLGAMLDHARAKFGVAILLDIHSMPTVAETSEGPGAQIVIGDSFGRTAYDRFTGCAAAVAEQHGLRTAINHPYAGGHILQQHARPQRGVHAIQIEIDRSLYLDAGFDKPAAGLEKICQFIARLAFALIDEALEQPQAIAAE
jgi:N-formylglutamate amidohydrolase